MVLRLGCSIATKLVHLDYEGKSFLAYFSAITSVRAHYSIKPPAQSLNLNCTPSSIPCSALNATTCIQWGLQSTMVQAKCCFMLRQLRHGRNAACERASPLSMT